MNNFKLVQLAATAAKAAPAAAKLKKATQEIEAIFVKDLMSAMRRTAKHQSLGNSLGGDMYQDMFDQALSETAAKTGTLGISQTIFRQMAPAAIRTALSAAPSRMAAPKPAAEASAGKNSDIELTRTSPNRPTASPTLGRDGRATSRP